MQFIMKRRFINMSFVGQLACKSFHTILGSATGLMLYPIKTTSPSPWRDSGRIDIFCRVGFYSNRFTSYQNMRQSFCALP